MLPYLVGSTGRIEGICSTNKQGVTVLLQEDFDEIVTLILQGAESRIKEQNREKVSGDISAFILSH